MRGTQNRSNLRWEDSSPYLSSVFKGFAKSKKNRRLGAEIQNKHEISTFSDPKSNKNLANPKKSAPLAPKSKNVWIKNLQKTSTKTSKTITP